MTALERQKKGWKFLLACLARGSKADKIIKPFHSSSYSVLNINELCMKWLQANLFPTVNVTKRPVLSFLAGVH